jgi:hypothetical protein
VGFLARPRHARQLWTHDTVTVRDLFLVQAPVLALLPDVARIDVLLHAAGRPAILFPDAIKSGDSLCAVRSLVAALTDAITVRDLLHATRNASILLLDVTDVRDLLAAQGSITLLLVDSVRTSETFFRLNRGSKILDSISVLDGIETRAVHSVLFLDSARLADFLNVRSVSVIFADGVKAADTASCIKSLLLPLLAGIATRRPKIAYKSLLLSDSAKLVDALNAIKAGVLLLVDTVSATDMPGSVKVLSPLLFTLIQRIPKFVHKGLALEDAVKVGDTLDAKLIYLMFVDSVRPTDVSNYIKTLPPLLFALAQRVSKLTYRSVALSDRTEIVDTFSARQIATFFTDSTGVIDAASYTKLPSPLLFTLAWPARFRPVYKSLVLPDAVTLRDALTVQKVNVVSAPDATRVTDTLSHTKRSVLLADRARIADIIPHLAYTDVLYYGPSASAACTAVRIPDRITIRDALTAKNLTVLFDDTARVPDWFGTRLPVTAVFKDSASTRDTFIAQSRTVLLADGITVRDTFIAQKS